MPTDGSTAVHEPFMRAALEEAQRAAEHGDAAVAALVTHGSEIVAISGSRVDTTGDPRACGDDGHWQGLRTARPRASA